MPVAQQGSDIYCDSKLITKTFFPELSLKPNSYQDKLADYLEKDIFYICLSAISGKDLMSYWKKEFGFNEFIKTVIDRSFAAKEFSSLRIPQKEAIELWDKHLDTLNNNLSDKFLFGDKPNAADFSAYHLIWFYLNVTENKANKKLKNLHAWYNRVKSIGYGKYTKIDNDFAIAQAKNTSPSAIAPANQMHEYIGQNALIYPIDYLKVPTKGTLVGSTDYSWILKRESKQCGNVHIHFPKKGFKIKLA